MKDKPKVLIFAGPNGSGKSTITTGYPIVGIYINADDIKRHRDCSDIEAAKEAETLREELVSKRIDFTFETVLSTERNLKLLEKAKSLGYHIESVFVLTADEEINVMRIKVRVLKGGHDVPEEKIRSRYHKSLRLLKALVTLSDGCIVVDNTVRPEIIFKKGDGEEIYLSNDFWEEDAVRKSMQ